jgi:hypothetical protein
MCNPYRWGSLAFLVGMYLLASTATWVIEERILPNLATGQAGHPAQAGHAGHARISLPHFRQPPEWGFSPSCLPQVLERMTEKRPGMLGKKWLYIGLLGTYLLLVCVVFLRFTQPPSPGEPD